MTRYIVTRANILVFFVLVAILFVIGGVTWDRYTAANTARALVRHTYDVIGTIKDLDLAIHDAEVGQLAFLLTGDNASLAPYDAALGRVMLLQGDLQHVTVDNPAQQERLRSLAPIVQQKLAQLAQTVALRRDHSQAAAVQLMAANAAPALDNDIATTLGLMAGEEHTLLRARTVTADDRASLMLWLVGGSTLLASGMLIWAARMLNQAWSRSYHAEVEQRALALRLRTSLDSLSQGIGVFDPEFRLTNWNECFHVLLNLPVAMMRAGAPYAELYDQVAGGAVPLLESEELVRHARITPGEPVVYERLHRPDGHELEVRRTGMPDGGFVLTISDMTKRSQAEAVLRESQKMEAIGHLTGGIAHDFNNLLTVVLGNLEFIRTKPSDEARLQTRLERAIWAAQRGATLTRQLLAFARKQPLAPAAVDLGATMPEMVPLLRRTLGEHIEVRYVEAAGLWPAMADPAQLESAVLNLALNARDAMPGGGRLTIELSNEVLDAEYAARHSEVVAGDYAMLAVSDTGHGMTPDVMARVFEPFFTTKPDGKGTGLGLAMVFGFVKQSGGHVKLYSEPGEGTTVRVYLPRATGAAVVRSRSAEAVELPRGSATILVVEDEPEVREIAVAILAELGYRVLQAGDGEEALLVFGAHTAGLDLLLTDVVLPGRLRGREVAERITAIRPEVLVLYMSGYTENSIVHSGRLDEGVHLISKPFQREQLARKVAEILAARPGRSVIDADENVVELKPRRGL